MPRAKPKWGWKRQRGDEKFKFSQDDHKALLMWIKEENIPQIPDLERLMDLALEEKGSPKPPEIRAALEHGSTATVDLLHFLRNMDEITRTDILVLSQSPSSFEETFDALADGFEDLIGELSKLREMIEKTYRGYENRKSREVLSTPKGRVAFYAIRFCEKLGIKTTNYRDSATVGIVDICLRATGFPMKSPGDFVLKFIKLRAARLRTK